MSFLGGGDASCSTAGNPLSQFQKHVQDDHSLQRDRLVGRGPGRAEEGFRTKEMPGRGNAMMDEFLQQPNQMPQPFAMDHMRQELGSIPTLPQQNGAAHWANEFDPGMSSNARMDSAFRHNSPTPAKFSPAEFQQYSHAQSPDVEQHLANPTTNMSQNMNGYSRPMGMAYGNTGYGGMALGMNGMGMNGMGMGMGMNGMGMMQEPLHSMNQQSHMQDKGKGRMVELDDKDWEAQFAEMETPDHGQEHNLDEEASRAMEAQLDQIDRSVVDSSHPDYDFGNFETIWNGIKEKLGLNTSDPYREMSDEAQSWRQHAGDFDSWDNFDTSNMNLNTHLAGPEAQNYLFESENIFHDIQDPFGEGCRIMDDGGNLSIAALAFEAAVQKQPDHVAAWARLGAAQAQNEKETPAIRALEQAMKLDPANLEALMGLAVSYTNEGYDSTAYRTLQRWLSVKYPSICPPEEISDAEVGFTDRVILQQKVTDLYIRAAQLSPSPESMDPDVQVGLGVLFYGAEEYEKAVDCFSAALASNEGGSTNQETANQRPLLWNRLGATLANSGRSEEAITAYEKALALNPNFVRARYNLGVSCINIGCYAEAAQHLLGALDMHRVVEKEGRQKAREIIDGGGGGAMSDDEFDRIIKQNESPNLYDTLRRVFGQMDRKDLQAKVGPGMDPAEFRGEFDF
ncbi:MAG: Peroxisomal membrane signal receptor PTS1 [Chrysothrix sp. TS-e1954]|nr:MAG: Peroxisomal membrane signal receptor PTS1 [Chrysothrix sp. TS-e1954]